ncbi:hypothetical protein H2204_008823 [Knufia peltigerae]|uniref:Uncharacterized protein n=1 Tax=Knufia peltigerae TaxID=1002370 RepID=A0AA39CWJ5_9EURO|nr:hypothetical protein H2204_008823 [Knufia peltigerae]
MGVYSGHSPALFHTLLSSAAMYLKFRDQTFALYDCAWRHRNIAISHLRKELSFRPFEISTLAGIVMLALTESWFDPAKNGRPHIKAGARLLKMHRERGRTVPDFIQNALCWLESLIGYVCDYQGLVHEEPAIYMSVDHEGGADSPLQKSSLTRSLIYGSALNVDPLVGTWSSLMPYVGMVGVAVRNLRKQGISDALLAYAKLVESRLMEWQNEARAATTVTPNDGCVSPGQCSTFWRGTQSDFNQVAEGISVNYFAIMAGIYCRAALLTFYTAFTSLLDIRLRTLTGTYSSSREFLRNMAASIIDSLEQIPQDNSLWNVSSFPVLAAGSSLARDDFQRQQYIIESLKKIKSRNKIDLVMVLGHALEMVWSKSESDDVDITWLEAFDQLGIEMLIN